MVAGTELVKKACTVGCPKAVAVVVGGLIAVGVVASSNGHGKGMQSKSVVSVTARCRCRRAKFSRALRAMDG